MADRGESADAAAQMRAVAVVSGPGVTSAYTWLKLPVLAGMDAVMRASGDVARAVDEAAAIVRPGVQASRRRLSA